MVNELTPLDDELMDEDDSSLGEDELEQSNEESTEEVDENPVVRKSDLDSLNKTLNEFRAEVGRLQSIEARLKRVEDPTERAAMEQSLRSEISRVNEVATSLVSGLYETAFVDPEVRSKVQNFLNEARTKADREELLKELRKEIQPQAQPQTQSTMPEWYTEGVRAFEEEWADRIEDEGFDSSAQGDFAEAWAKAGALVRSGRPVADARQIMREHLRNLKTERQTARQRNQAKKNAGGGTPKAAGGSVSILDDPNRTLEEKAAELRRMGITVG